ncbi:MAG TPA: hypothetical protein VNK04_07565 [Gemmataceae bacterium]|nr:hypothetical protein [Gemmataceae bacterium]
MFPHRHAWAGLLVLAATLPAPAAEVNRYLPDDTEVVVFVNVRQLLDAPLIKKHALEQLRAALKENPEGEKFLNAVGLDPFRDIQSVTLAAPGSRAPDRVLLIVAGNFNLDRIHAVADGITRNDPDAVKVHRQGSLRIYESRGKKDGGTGFAAFIDRHTLLVSPAQETVVAAARGAGSQGPRVKKELQELIRQADPGQSLWFAALATSEVREVLKGNPQTATVAEKITSFTGAAALGDAVQVAIQIHATDAGSADEVRRLMEALKGFVQFAALSSKEYGPLFGDILDALTVSSRKNTVTIGGKVPGDLIERGLKKGKRP